MNIHIMIFKTEMLGRSSSIAPAIFGSFLLTKITLSWFWSHFLITVEHSRNCNGETEDIFAKILAIEVDLHSLCFYIENFDDLIHIILVAQIRFYCTLWHCNFQKNRQFFVLRITDWNVIYGWPLCFKSFLQKGRSWSKFWWLSLAASHFTQLS